MPLRSDMLHPIPGANAAGENLRYAPIFDRIKEARRQDDDAPQGEWQRERKLADWPLTIKLAGEAIATKSKDLQLAAWLTEALLRQEGVSGLKDGLDLLRGLLENFWDNLYPELEDGDAEFRATPLQWVGDRLEQPLKSAPLARNGFDWFQYKESRAVGYEQDVAGNAEKMQARQEAIGEGRITAEAFDDAVAGSPKQFYVQLLEGYDGALESLAALGALCDGKFGDASPSFGKLQGALEEVRQTARILLAKKLETEPGEEAPAPVAVSVEASEPEPVGYAAAAPARAPAPVRKASVAAEPADREDAVARLIAVAAYLRREDPYSPAPYLMLRGLRWGELRAGGESVDPAVLEAPPGEIRQEIKRLSTEGDWAEVLERAETAMGMACGRGWLDLQRYTCRACAELGYEAIASAIRAELRALLTDYPQLAELTLMDDTATANAETQAWLKETVLPAPAPAEPAYVPPPQAEAAETAPDALDIAMEAAQSGRLGEGIAIMAREIAHEPSGRGRFHRKVQLAQLCVAAGCDSIAVPILNELAGEIERRGLEQWEAAEVVAHPLVLLFGCLGRLETGPEVKQKLYDRICRLDPVQALACVR